MSFFYGMNDLQDGFQNKQDQQGTKVNTMLASGEVIDVISMDYDQVNFRGHARNGTSSSWTTTWTTPSA